MYKYMDDVEVDICAIKNLKLIHFYHVLKEDKCIPAVMVHYDLDKMMNLCVLDKHYDELVAQVFMVYESSDNKDEIIMDHYSRSIIDKAISADTGYYKKYLKRLAELDKPLYYHQSYMPYIVVPVIKYVIEQLYSITGKKIQWNPIESSWFGKGTLSATAVNGEETFPYVLTQEEVGKYSVRVGNFFTLKDSLDMQIIYDHSGISINAHSNGAGVEASIAYAIDDDSDQISVTSNVILKDKTVFSDNSMIAKGEKWSNTEKIETLLGFDNENSDYYQLPWGQYLLYENDRETDETTDTKNVKIGYVTVTEERNNGFVISYNSISNPKQKSEFMIFNFATDIFEEKIFGEDIQVYFDPLGFRSRGYYKANMADRYFKMKDK